MYLLDIIPLTKISPGQPPILSYFSSLNLLPGAIVQVPLGRRKEKGVVIGSRDMASSKMEIKNAVFELRNVNKIISTEPVLTEKQIELALFLGQYYFCAPGIFAKMMLPQIPNPNKILKSKPQKLIIAPTISQAQSLSSLCPKSFVLWHSELTQKQKNAVWLAVKTSQAQMIIGTRSAVFLPFNNLKKIIIEDEPNPNHKSWDMWPHYDSRLVAQKLTKLFNCKIKEFSHPEQSEGFIKDSSPTAQNDKNLTPVIVDMRQELKNGNFSIFSLDLYEAIKNALGKNQQTILFINRRGAANFILCRDCGYIAKCANCDAPLAYHLINARPSLFCHHCGSKAAPPAACPNCRSWRIKTVGSGSQKVESETKKFFPDAKILRLDSDNTPKPKDQQKIIADFTEHQTDILIATPMIFSWIKELAAVKPSVIGVLSADTLLHIPDFRSGERTWQTIVSLRQLLYYPSERSKKSRGSKATRATGSPDFSATSQNDKLFLIQTYNPANSVLKYIKQNDWGGFIKEDSETRQILNYPPFSQIVKLTFRHRDAKKAGPEAKILSAKLRHINKNAKIDISEALPAFIPREKGKYVWNIILKFKIENLKLKINNEFLQQRNSLLQYIPPNWETDVDPENLL